jgi:heme oxygenase
MATPGSDGKNDFPGATPIFDHEHALASVQAGSRRARFSPPMGWQRGRARRGDGAVPHAGRLPDPRTAMSIHGHMMVPSPGGADVSGSMRSLLRASTAGLHAVVDARFAPMLDAGEAGYRSFLLASAAAVFPLEQALLTAGVDLLLPDWTRRTRAAALRADLTDLGITDVVLATAPPLAGAAGMFGMLYVLEGSRLGARLLVPDLLAGGSTRVRAATRYLRHGEGHRLWQSFLTHLESSQPVRECPDEAIAGARIAFALFIAGRPEAGLRARRVAAETADAD